VLASPDTNLDNNPCKLAPFDPVDYPFLKRTK
jgi:hypothetical protein